MSSAPAVTAARNYPLLLVSQFLGAFGDNAVLAVLVGRLTWLNRDHLISDTELATRGVILTGLLFIPYIFLSPLVGWANDRFPKTSCLTVGNLIKVLGTLICLLAGANYPMQGFGYLIVGVGSALYGPGKYGILPEILPRGKLVKANGLVELLTLLAILFGAVGGSWLADHFHTDLHLPLAIVAGLFGAAFVLNALMVRTPCQPGLKVAESFSGFLSHFRLLFRSRRMGSVLIGTALFWVCGAAMKSNFQPWGLKVMGFPNNTTTSLLAIWLALGTMVGSILAGRFFVVGDLRHTRRNALLMSAMVCLLATVAYFPVWLKPSFQLMGADFPIPVVIHLMVAGIFAGLFLIPLNAALQAESPPEAVGKTIAVQNLSDNIGMLLAMLIVFATNYIGTELPAGLNAAALAARNSSAVWVVLAVFIGLALLPMRFNRPKGT